MPVERAPEINRKSGPAGGLPVVELEAQAPSAVVRAVKVSALAPLGLRLHPAHQLRQRTLRSGVTEVWHPPESYVARDLNDFVDVRHVRSNKSLERTREG
jgi:hypothetical protein